MKIALITSVVPFIRDEADFLAETLKKQLIKAGHQTLIIRLPFESSDPEKILEHLLACRLMLLDKIDRVIALKFPVCFIPHPHKTIWLLQPLPLEDLPEPVKQSVIKASCLFFKEAKKILTLSRDIGDQLKKYCRIESEILSKNLGKKSLEKLL